MEVYELDETILDYLTKRNLVSQYKKAKEFLKNSHLSSVKFKKLQPKSLARIIHKLIYCEAKLL